MMEVESKQRMELQHPLTSAPVFPEPGRLHCLVVRHAGYFHPHVLCHHRPGGSVLHYLSALVAWSYRGCEGKDGAEAPSILLADAPVEFCFWALFGSGVPASKRALPNSRTAEVLASSSASIRRRLTLGQQGLCEAEGLLGTSGVQGRHWQLLRVFKL